MDDLSYPTDAEAWSIALKATHWWASNGFKQKPTFKNGAIKKSIDCIGWDEIRQGREEITRAHFFKVYNAFVNREKAEKINGG